MSTLDLLGRGFVLLTAPGGTAWRVAAAGMAAPRIACDVIDDGAGWMTLYGIDADGAVLVRPDGHVAWRSRGGADDPSARLGAVLDAVLCRPGDGGRSPS